MILQFKSNLVKLDWSFVPYPVTESVWPWTKSYESFDDRFK